MSKYTIEKGSIYPHKKSEIMREVGTKRLNIFLLITIKTQQWVSILKLEKEMMVIRGLLLHLKNKEIRFPMSSLLYHLLVFLILLSLH